jgi:hypothetical protein
MDRTPKFGDRIMVMDADIDGNPEWKLATVLPAPEGPSDDVVRVDDFGGLSYLLHLGGDCWRWPEPGEWGDDE